MFMAGISGIIPGVNSVAVGAPDGTDPYWENTVLLLSGDGTPPSSIFPDESYAAHGNANDAGCNYDNTNKVLGSGSLQFDSGFDDYLWFADHDDWALGTSDFTLEMFVRFSEVATTQVIIGLWNTVDNQLGWRLLFRPGTTQLEFSASPDGSSFPAIVSGTFNPTINTFYYVCAERSGNTFRLYSGPVAGTASMIDSATDSIDIYNASPPRFTISGSGNGARMYGNIDELRLTKGVARYATDAGYPVPTAKFPRS